VPKLQTASELRGFSASDAEEPKPGAPDSYYDDDDDISPEEAEKIQDLLQFVSDDLRGRPRGARAEEVGRDGPESSSGQVTIEEPEPAAPRRSWGLLVWIAGGGLAGLLLASWLTGHHGEESKPSAPVAVTTASVLATASIPAPAAEAPAPQALARIAVDAGAAAGHNRPVPASSSPESASSSSPPLKPTYQVQN
jgi:hypothetical protein